MRLLLNYWKCAFNTKAQYVPHVHWISTSVRQLCDPVAAKYVEMSLNGQTFEHKLLLLAQHGDSHPILIQLSDASVAGRIDDPKVCIIELNGQRDL